MTYFERVQEALGRLREHLRDLVSSSRVAELETQLAVSEREKVRVVEAVERFVAETILPAKAPPIEPPAETKTASVETVNAEDGVADPPVEEAQEESTDSP